MQTFSNFADLASFIAEETGSTDQASTYAHAFIEHDERAKLSIVDEAEVCFMPDPDQARAAVEMVMTTLFDVLRDTRLEPFAADLAWGFANSFHVVAKRIEGREDDAARELGELVRISDPRGHPPAVRDARELPRGNGVHARPRRASVPRRNRTAFLDHAGIAGQLGHDREPDRGPRFPGSARSQASRGACADRSRRDLLRWRHLA